MDARQIVIRAIEFRTPPRLPFLQHEIPDLPDDIWECLEMDRAKKGWFFDNCAENDWGSQDQTFVSPAVFEYFFMKRYLELERRPASPRPAAREIGLFARLTGAQ